jgi:hypothetical protein
VTVAVLVFVAFILSMIHLADEVELPDIELQSPAHATMEPVDAAAVNVTAVPSKIWAEPVLNTG